MPNQDEYLQHEMDEAADKNDDPNFLVCCPVDDDPDFIDILPGSTKEHNCSKCGCLVWTAPSGQQLLKVGHEGAKIDAIICHNCFFVMKGMGAIPKDATHRTVPGAQEELDDAGITRLEQEFIRHQWGLDEEIT
jgi:hypothetical protein